MNVLFDPKAATRQGKQPAGVGESRRRLAVLVVLALPMLAAAAGGHFTVDDAAILEPGQCQVDVWLERDPKRDRSLWHVGPACRVGAFEIGASVDRNVEAGDAATAGSPQVKWATALGERLSVGVVAALTLQGRHSRYAGAALVAPLSWRVTETVQTHLDLGVDFQRGLPRELRPGAALEWQPASGWLLIGEAFRQSRSDHARVGARWSPSSAVSIDLSRAWRLDGTGPAGWTVGVTWAFELRGRGQDAAGGR